MNFKTGKLYLIKKRYWFLYPTKETAAALSHGAVGVGLAAVRCRRVAAGTAAEALNLSKYLSSHYNCNITYITENSIFCLIEQDGKYLKVLSSNGESGWIYLANWLEMHIQEVKQ